MARIGEVIDGKYEILSEIGRGGMSVVYLAMDKRLNKQWAIKEFRKDKDDVNRQIALKSLLAEANLMKKLDHPYLPRIVDIIDNYQNVYIIMDYIEGESLNKILDAYGAQPQNAVIEWAKQLSEALDYLHTQEPPVIYRDMKPANIMLKPDGTIRLIDFGIAREYKVGKDGDTEAIGTRGYAAPEQFGGRGQTDARTDIYSFGVTLYHLVTGKNPAEPPYEIYPIRHWNPSYSSGLEWLIQKCTQLNPEDRYQSCAEVTYVLNNLDKFDAEYKRKGKSRLHLFTAFLLATTVFVTSSVACLVGSSVVRSNSYEELVKNGHYIEAIEVDSDRSEAYLELSRYLASKDNTKKIIDGDARNVEDIETVNEVTTGDISSWFPTTLKDSTSKLTSEELCEIYYNLIAAFIQYGDIKIKEGDNDMSPVIQDASKYASWFIDAYDASSDDEEWKKRYTEDVSAIKAISKLGELLRYSPANGNYAGGTDTKNAIDLVGEIFATNAFELSEVEGKSLLTPKGMAKVFCIFANTAAEKLKNDYGKEDTIEGKKESAATIIEKIAGDWYKKYKGDVEWQEDDDRKALIDEFKDLARPKSEGE